MSIATIQGNAERNCEHDVLYWKTWMAKQKTLELLFGIHEKSFQDMPRMLLAIKDSNLGIIFTWNHKMVNSNKTIFRTTF